MSSVLVRCLIPVFRGRPAAIRQDGRTNRTMQTNTIAKIETVNVDGPNGPMTAIMISLNAYDPFNASAFIQEVISAFKSQRMMSAPNTSGLLVTIMGPLSAETFAQQWRAVARADQPLAFFMSQMTVADVIQGTPSGQVLSKASLV